MQAQLQTLIEGGGFKRNERLPSEIELARSFGVSRPVIREALMSLQALGLTASQTGKGTFVVSDRVSAPLLMGGYSPAHVKEVRRYLEIPSARLAALRRTDRDIGELAEILARIEDADDPARRNRLDADFHVAIAAAAGNPLIGKLVEDMRSVLEEHSLALAKIPRRRREASVGARGRSTRRSSSAIRPRPQPPWRRISSPPSAASGCRIRDRRGRTWRAVRRASAQTRRAHHKPVPDPHGGHSERPPDGRIQRAAMIDDPACARRFTKCPAW